MAGNFLREAEPIRMCQWKEWLGAVLDPFQKYFQNISEYLVHFGNFPSTPILLVSEKVKFLPQREAEAVGCVCSLQLKVLPQGLLVESVVCNPNLLLCKNR